MKMRFVILMFVSSVIGVSSAIPDSGPEIEHAMNFIKERYVRTVRYLLGEDRAQDFIKPHDFEGDMLGPVVYKKSTPEPHEHPTTLPISNTTPDYNLTNGNNGTFTEEKAEAKSELVPIITDEANAFKDVNTRATTEPSIENITTAEPNVTPKSGEEIQDGSHLNIGTTKSPYEYIIPEDDDDVTYHERRSLWNDTLVNLHHPFLNTANRDIEEMTIKPDNDNNPSFGYDDPELPHNPKLDVEITARSFNIPVYESEPSFPPDSSESYSNETVLTDGISEHNITIVNPETTTETSLEVTSVKGEEPLTDDCDLVNEKLYNVTISSGPIVKNSTDIENKLTGENVRLNVNGFNDTISNGKPQTETSYDNEAEDMSVQNITTAEAPLEVTTIKGEEPLPENNDFDSNNLHNVTIGNGSIGENSTDAWNKTPVYQVTENIDNFNDTISTTKPETEPSYDNESEGSNLQNITTTEASLEVTPIEREEKFPKDDNLDNNNLHNVTIIKGAIRVNSTDTEDKLPGDKVTEMFDHFNDTINTAKPKTEPSYENKAEDSILQNITTTEAPREVLRIEGEEQSLEDDDFGNTNLYNVTINNGSIGENSTDTGNISPAYEVTENVDNLNDTITEVEMERGQPRHFGNTTGGTTPTTLLHFFNITAIEENRTTFTSATKITDVTKKPYYRSPSTLINNASSISISNFSNSLISFHQNVEPLVFSKPEWINLMKVKWANWPTSANNGTY